MSIFDAADYIKDAKREQRAFDVALSGFAQDAALRELFGDDPGLILGSLHELADLLKTKAFREAARERGEELRRQKEASRPTPPLERLRLQLAEEPVGELATKLETYARETAPSIRPIIFAGVGSAEEIKFLMGPGARLKRHPLEARSSEGGCVSAPNQPATENGYKVAKMSATKGITVLSATTEQIEVVLEEAIRQEGPISEPLLFDRIKTAFGVHSIRKDAALKIRGILRGSIERGCFLEIDPGFFMAADGTVIVRNRSGQDEKVRALSNMPPCEIGFAVEDLVQRGNLSNDEDLTCTVARLLGYTLKSPNTLPALAAAIDREITCRALSRGDETSSPPSDPRPLPFNGGLSKSFDKLSGFSAMSNATSSQA